MNIVFFINDFFSSHPKFLSSVSDQVREMVKEYEHKYTEVLYHHVQEDGLDQPHINIQDSITDSNTNSEVINDQFSSTTPEDANHSIISPDHLPDEKPHQHKSVILETGHETELSVQKHRGEHIAGYTHQHTHADHDGHLHVEQPLKLEDNDEEEPGTEEHVEQLEDSDEEEEHAHIQHQHQHLDGSLQDGSLHLDGSLHSHLLPVYTSSQEEQVWCGGTVQWTNHACLLIYHGL